MQFYTKQHKSYCGIDLHARSMYVCVLHQDGAIVMHRNMQASPDTFLRTVAPYRDDLVVAVACVFPWYWLADLCAQEGMPFVLGHALSMQAIHGGKATNDTIDAHKSAVLLRGGLLPQTYVYPAEMRATRDLLRRRLSLSRTRAELLAHLQNTNSQYNLPEIGKKLAYKATRDGVAERFPAPAVPAEHGSGSRPDRLRRSPAQRCGAAYRQSGQAARRPDSVLAPDRARDRDILRLVLLYEMHDIQRFPRVPGFCLLLPPGHMCTRIRRETLRHLGKQDR